jgi:predicted ATP-grasp superfamily ATP-dependent carboligase
MRILVHEFASGGGFAGRPVPTSLAREGRAMLIALLADLSALGRHQIVTTTDSRFAPTAPDGVDVVTIHPGCSVLDLDLLTKVDAVWLIAPETGGSLERLASTVERAGKTLLGAGSRAIRRAADKRGLPLRLARCGVSHPRTRVVRAGCDFRAIVEDLGNPVVVKPARGAGCHGVHLAHNWRELQAAVDRIRPSAPLIAQRYVPGVAASVSLISNGRRAVPLSINAQGVRTGRTFSYRGGCTPLEHPLAERGIETAIRACEALPDLRGYVGVDLVLTDSAAVVIEVNPRLTTAYLGVRAALGGRNGDGNVAAMAIEACRGRLPTPPALRRRVQFTSAGRIVVTP